jgi:hypothetical protein
MASVARRLDAGRGRLEVGSARHGRHGVMAEAGPRLNRGCGEARIDEVADGDCSANRNPRPNRRSSRTSGRRDMSPIGAHSRRRRRPPNRCSPSLHHEYRRTDLRGSRHQPGKRSLCASGRSRNCRLRHEAARPPRRPEGGHTHTARLVASTRTPGQLARMPAASRPAGSSRCSQLSSITASGSNSSSKVSLDLRHPRRQATGGSWFRESPACLRERSFGLVGWGVAAPHVRQRRRGPRRYGRAHCSVAACRVNDRG